jgi:glycerol-1-phosphate dehydrogenase [NAD(P)+]
MKTLSDPKGSSWTTLIDEASAGTWIDPETGQSLDAAFKHIDIAEEIDVSGGTTIKRVMPAQSYVVVSDQNTYEVLGRKIREALGGSTRSVVLDKPHADEAEVAKLIEKTKDAEAVIAVGSGTINDLCKYATYKDGRDYCVFGTAPSMNGYTSTTASITLENGMKTTLPAHAAKGVFLDLNVNAQAPQYLIAAGLGDSICRPTAQVDWYFSHLMLSTKYSNAPYVLQQADEQALFERSDKLGQGDIDAVGYLHRVMTLCGFGISVTGMSHPGSMGEHQISHWIDNFAGVQHPGTVHGTQVGVASLTMAKLQEKILSSELPPRVKATVIDEKAIRARYPASAVEGCLKAIHAKALDENQASQFNEKLAEIWPEQRLKMQSMAMSSVTLATHLQAAGGGITANEIGLPRDLYRKAVRYSLELRDRYSMLDLAADMDILDDFVDTHC